MTNLDLRRSLIERGIVDTHFHVGPELLDRRYDVATLAHRAAECNLTLVLKNHTYSTTPLASLARSQYGVRFLGSVVLNRFVGGLNPDAIYGAASGNRSETAGGGSDPNFVVYMPTVHAASHLRTLGSAFDPRWSGGQPMKLDGFSRPDEAVDVFDTKLHPVPSLVPVLKAIADTGSILATGHLNAAEVVALVPMALDAGVQRILLTHPHYPSVELSDEQLVALSQDPRVFIEHCFAIHTIEHVPLNRFAQSIVATGSDQVVLATDFGQVISDVVPEGTFRFAEELLTLLANKIPLPDYLAMFTGNGRRALKL